MKRVKLMADYFCYPLWDASGQNFGDINPANLPISNDLQRDLLSWADKFDAILNQEDPASSGFADESSEQRFKHDGISLGERLQKELGDAYEVIIQV